MTKLHSMVAALPTSYSSSASSGSGMKGSAYEGAGAGSLVKNPKCIPASTHAIVSIALDTPVLMEPASGCRALARFALRALGKTVAVGTCEKLL